MQQTSKEIEIGCDNSIPISTSCNPVFAMNNRNSISTALQFDISPLAAASFVDVSAGLPASAYASSVFRIQ